MPEGSHSLKTRCPERGQSVVFELCSTLVLFRNGERKINPKSVVQDLLRLCRGRLAKPRPLGEAWTSGCLPTPRTHQPQGSQRPVPGRAALGGGQCSSPRVCQGPATYLLISLLTSDPRTHALFYWQAYILQGEGRCC